MRVSIWLAGLVVTVLAGCKSTPVAMVTPSTATPAPLELKDAKPTRLAPAANKVPLADALTEQPGSLFARPEGTFKGISEKDVIEHAKANASTAKLLENEGQVVTVSCNDHTANSSQSFLAKIRALMATDARNKAAGEALERYYQLADAETRGEMVLDAMKILDAYRPKVKEANPRYTRLPLPEIDELDRKRADLLLVYTRAEEGSQLLNIDLKRRLGLPGTSTERLWPAVDLSVDTKVLDTEAMVQTALENRADLQALRLAYLELNGDTLPSVKDYMKGISGSLMGGVIGRAMTRPKVLEGVLRPKTIDPALVQEVALRKQQLFEMVAEKERGVADEVRALSAGINAQTKRVALARWKMEQAEKKWKDIQEKKYGELAELPLELLYKQAQADVVAEAATWHGLKIKMQTAQGLFGQ